MTRSAAWNVAFLGLEGCLIGWAHFVVGVSWWTIGAGLAAVLACGIALITYVVKVHTPRAIRRHQDLLGSYRTAAVTAHNQRDLVHRVPMATPGPDQVVDGQSTPHVAAPSLTVETSRAR